MRAQLLQCSRKRIYGISTRRVGRSDYNSPALSSRCLHTGSLRAQGPKSIGVVLAATAMASLLAGAAVATYKAGERPILSDSELGALSLTWSELAEVPPQPEALDLKAANAKLRKEEFTRSFYSGKGKLGTAYIVRLASNNPVEDQFAISAGVPPEISDASNVSFFGVYDGHAGWATSAYLKQHLIPWVAKSLDALPKNSPNQVVTQAISNAFLTMDEKIMQAALKKVKEGRPEADAGTVVALAPAVAGSCALLACYEPLSSLLRVACVGDSRAVLGQYSPSQRVYETTVLSEDQSGKSKSEIARLDAEHPNEPEMIKGLETQGRIFGLMCTRAFGDHRWKFDRETLETIRLKYFGSSPRPHAKTPPYVTARPEITETVVKKVGKDAQGNAKPSFAILATDGLWDHMSSEDAVKCVEGWIEAKSKAESTFTDGTSPQEVTSQDISSSPVLKSDQGYADWQYQRDWFIAEDDNAATHLVRNALGGKNRGMFCGVMSTYAPMSRNVRDDITVQVIFFNG